jgi:hypothetical protein
MTAESVHKASLQERAVEEFKLVLVLALYLYICLGALLLLKTAILRGEGISYTAWGLAAVKALVLAKFMAVGRAMGLGQRYRHKPLIWPTLHQSLMFLIVLLILTTIEEVLMGFIHHRPLAESLTHVVGSTFLQGLAICLIMFLILTPYCGFNVLGSVLGEDKLVRLFFIARDDLTDGRVHSQPKASETS